MGSISAMNSIERVLNDHEQELKEEYYSTVPESIRNVVTGVELLGDIYHVNVTWVVRSPQDGGEESEARLEGPQIDIDALAERFPCCEVGY